MTLPHRFTQSDVRFTLGVVEVYAVFRKFYENFPNIINKAIWENLFIEY